MERSNSFADIKEKVLNCGESDVYSDCEEYISNLILDGLNSSNNFFQAYCAYAYSLGVTYIRNTDSIMFVTLREGVTSLSIDAVNVISNVENEGQIFFILAHEVKHLLFAHLSKYGNMFHDDVVSVFLNIATDVEVNESLKEDLSVYSWGNKNSAKDYVPKHAMSISTIAKILDMDIDYLKSLLRSKSSNISETMADTLYRLLNDKCKKLLGFSILEILYKILLKKGTTFTKEIFKVADGGKSDIFDIFDVVAGRKFCNEISLYLKRSVTSMISVNTNDKGNGDSGGGFKDFRTARGMTTSRGLSPMDISDTVSDMEEMKTVLVTNIGVGKGQSSYGSGFRHNTNLASTDTYVPWQSILRNRMKSLSTKRESTKKRVNRRQPERLELSGSKRKKIINIVVGIDESGSISNEEYSYFISELFKVVSDFECRIHLYEFTSDIESYTYMKEREVSKFKREGLSIFKSRFCGGTLFQPVFDAVNANKDIKKSDCLMVMFTDGFGEKEVTYGNVIDRLWVVVNSDCRERDGLLSCDELYKNIYPVVSVGR